MRVLRVKKKKGEAVRKRLAEQGLIRNDFRIGADEKFLYLPLKESDKNVEKLGELVEFKLRKRRIPKKEKILRDRGVARSHDIIGDIVVLEMLDVKKAGRVAEDYLKFYKNAKTVVVKLGKTSGEFRIRKVRVVAGEKKVETLHRENGCSFVVNLNKVFYTPRLSSERKRVINLVKNGEVVVDLFAGVGPYIIPIAKNKRVNAFAVDKNPDAYKLLVRNVGLNRVGVKCFLGDAKSVKLPKADRIIMNLPKTSESFLDSALKISKKGTIVHFYHFSPEEDLFKSHKKRIREKARSKGFRVKFLRAAKAGEVGIRQYRIVIDFKVY